MQVYLTNQNLQNLMDMQALGGMYDTTKAKIDGEMSLMNLQPLKARITSEVTSKSKGKESVRAAYKAGVISEE